MQYMDNPGMINYCPPPQHDTVQMTGNRGNSSEKLKRLFPGIFWVLGEEVRILPCFSVFAVTVYW